MLAGCSREFLGFLILSCAQKRFVQDEKVVANARQSPRKECCLEKKWCIVVKKVVANACCSRKFLGSLILSRTRELFVQEEKVVANARQGPHE
jgi:GTP-sensing pleiotropic transcriptional regulator CodY